MHVRAHLVALALLTSPAVAQSGNSPASSGTLASAQLQIAQPTSAPGTTLSRGTYAVRVADRLQDRLIVQIQKTGSGSSISLLGYPNPALRGGSFTGPITFVSGLKGKPTLRGYAFPGGPVVEFVFPKADAVDLAKANNVRVMAVDTASEGKVALPNLTQTDMSEVTLWMLTPTAVDPATSKPGIQAARYQAPAAAESPTPTQNAAVAPPTPVQPAQADTSSAPTPAAAPARRPAPAASTQVAVNHAPRIRANIKQLPHTASSLPMIFLVGCASLCGGILLTLRRKLSSI